VTCSDTLIVVILDAVTSIFAGFAIFSIIGHLAHTLNTGVDQVVTSGMFTVELCVKGKKSKVITLRPLYSAKAGHCSCRGAAVSQTEQAYSYRP